MNDKVFRALADPTRRAILKLLASGDLPAGEIASRFPQAQPTISRHLHVLSEAQLVLDRREGSHVIYSLNVTVVQQWLGAVMTLFGEKG